MKSKYIILLSIVSILVSVKAYSAYIIRDNIGKDRHYCIAYYSEMHASTLWYDDRQIPPSFAQEYQTWFIPIIVQCELIEDKGDTVIVKYNKVELPNNCGYLGPRERDEIPKSNYFFVPVSREDINQYIKK